MVVDESFPLPSLSVAATADQLHILRALVRSRGRHHDLAADAVADLVLAVDEAASTLLRHTPTCSTLTCTVGADPGSVSVILTGTTSAMVDTSTTSFSWFVLQTLVDSVALEQCPSAVAGPTQMWAVTVTMDMTLKADP